MDATQGPATGVEGIGGSTQRRTTLLGRLTGFGKLQLQGCHEPLPAPLATQSAMDSEAATNELAVEQVTSCFGQSQVASSKSWWSRQSHLSESRTYLSQLASESSTQSTAQARSRAQARFLKKVGRTETEESKLEMDYSLAVHDEELLRAVPASAILGCSGRTVISSKQGCDATFTLSKPVMYMHYFVSHSWQTPAWLKMVCLMYEMNADRAVVAAVATQIVMGALQTAGLWNSEILPPGVFYFVDGQRVHEVLVEAHWVISCLVFFLVLRWGQAIPMRESLCFLDKCCINQTDSVKKAAGIKQLGAFLRNSEYLLILWQPDYFTRLWCIYELAAFSHVNRGSCDRVLIRPLKLSVFVVSYSVFYTCVELGYAYLFPCTFNSSQHAEWMIRTMPVEGQRLLYRFFAYCMFLICFLLLPCLVTWKFFEWHAKDLRTLLQQLSEFHIADTKCQFVEDRIFVVEQITEWFGSTEEFEIYVRSVLHNRVEKLLQDQWPIPYGTVLVGSLSNLLLSTSGWLSAWNGGDTEYMWRWLLNCGTHFLFAVAISMHLGFLLGGTGVGEDADGKSCFRRKLAGPLLFTVATSISSSCLSSILHPGVPLWHWPIHFVIAAVMTALLFKRAWWQRASAYLQCLCAMFSSAGRRPEQTASSGPTADASQGASDSRP
jgi:hypothetical protein